MRVLRKRKRTKITNRPTPALSFTLRAATPLGSGIHARYAVAVAGDRTVNRAAWAEVVQELLDRETKGKKLPLARLIGVDATTVSRWLRQGVAVSEESVRAVARAFDRPPVELLVRVGYYHPDEFAPPPAPDPDDDRVIQHIRANPDLTDAERAELIEAQREQIEADYLRRLADYERTIRVWRGRSAG